MKRLAFFLLLSLAGCNDNGSPPPIPASKSEWTIRYSQNMPYAPTLVGDGFYFDIPPPPGSVHYITKGTLGINGTLTAKFDITPSPDAVFNYKISPDNVCPGNATVRLYFQRAGDDLSAVGDKQFYRWWSSQTYDLKPGQGELSVALTPDQWTSVYGKQDPAQFQAALANIDNAGITFGGGCFAGHGVNMLSGTARFTLQSFQ